MFLAATAPEARSSRGGGPHASGRKWGPARNQLKAIKMPESSTKHVFIIAGARTPMAEYAGRLKDVSALELGAIAARAALARASLAPDAVDHAVFGNVLQSSSDAVYGARHVALKAGVPVH